MAGGASLASRISRPWGPLIRGRLTARLVVSMVTLIIVTCAVLGFATYTVLSRQLMASFNQQLQEATSRASLTCGDTPQRTASTSAYRGDQQNWGPQRNRAPGPSGGDNPANCGPNIQGQSANTFDAWLTSSGSVVAPIIIDGKCHLSAADKTTLRALHVYQPPAPGNGSPDHDNSLPTAPTYTRSLSSLGGDYELTAVRSRHGSGLPTGL